MPIVDHQPLSITVDIAHQLMVRVLLQRFLSVKFQIQGAVNEDHAAFTLPPASSCTADFFQFF